MQTGCCTPWKMRVANPGLMAFGRAVDHPDLVGGPPQIVAHPLEAGAVEEAGDGDEADDAASPGAA